MFIKERDRKILEQKFLELGNPVKIILFTKSIDCEYCETTEQLLKELVSISDKLSLYVFNSILDKEQSRTYGVDSNGMVPAIFIETENFKPKLKFFGTPSGYEFSTLIEDIVDVSKNTSQFSNESVIEKIKSINEPVNIKVFVTPTCPYCPKMVRYAHMASILNENITSEMIEASEFPELSQKYSVFGVPKTVINETIEIEGAVPEEHFVEEILKALKKKPQN